MLPLLLLLLASSVWGQEPAASTDAPVTEASPSSIYCPALSAIKPCMCTLDYENATATGVHLMCQSILSSKAMTTILEIDFPTGDHLWALDIQNSTFSRLTKDVFAGKTFVHINISRHTGRLSVNQDSFVGMENYLEVLTIRNVSVSEPLTIFRAITDLTSLKTFEMYGNEMTELPDLYCPPSLKKVVISGNPIGRITRDTFRRCSSLEELVIEHAQIRTVGADTFLDLVNLKKLVVPHNGFTALRQNSFRVNAPNLKFIDLSHNDLFQLQDGWFSGEISSTAQVNLNNNNMTTFHRGAIEPLLLEVKNGGFLNAKTNPIVCACELAWLVRDAALRRTVREVSDANAGSGIRCHRGTYGRFDHWLDQTRWFGNALSSLQGNLGSVSWIRDNPVFWAMIEGMTGRYFSQLRATDFNNCPW